MTKTTFECRAPGNSRISASAQSISEANVEKFELDLIKQPDEQILFCPVECVPTYRQYMDGKKINYTEHGIVDGSFAFSLSRRYRPHARLETSFFGIVIAEFYKQSGLWAIQGSLVSRNYIFWLVQFFDYNTCQH